MIEKEFIPYKQALDLKELGFDEPCLGYWRNEDSPNPITIGQYTTKEDIEYEISGQDEYHNFKNIIALAPLYQQAFRWFREKYDLHRHICYFEDTTVWHGDIYNIKTGGLMNYPMELTNYNTYEEAELACLRKLIETVKNF
jgi:hypothetical protein